MKNTKPFRVKVLRNKPKNILKNFKRRYFQNKRKRDAEVAPVILCDMENRQQLSNPYGKTAQESDSDDEQSEAFISETSDFRSGIRLLPFQDVSIPSCSMNENNNIFKGSRRQPLVYYQYSGGSKHRNKNKPDNDESKQESDSDKQSVKKEGPNKTLTDSAEYSSKISSKPLTRNRSTSYNIIHHLHGMLVKVCSKLFSIKL